ncbi:MAG: SDR family NAD(P)-dependent oxidoreductase [Flavobacteriaceae bacterium]
MKLSKNTVLVTGGSSGIGLELSKQLLLRANKVIICGRSKSKLLEAQKLFPKLEIFQCDLSDKNQCNDLVNWLNEKHPELNVLINNAAIVHKTSFIDTKDIIEMAELETATNFLAPIRLIKLLHPLLKINNNPNIINITTGLIYAPRVDYPFYNATKAALHSFTQTLRIQLAKTNIKVIEVMFPAVKTPWHKGNPPKIAITSQKAVSEMIKRLEGGDTEIKIAGVKILYALSRIAPKFALKKINSLKSEK